MTSVDATEQHRILVVDDEPSITDAVATALRYEGFDVEIAATGRAGLSAAQSRPPDLVVLDVMLPDLDGIEVTRRLRADGITVPILFLTARDAWRTSSPASPSEGTTTSPSRSPWPRSWPASASSCAGPSPVRTTTGCCASPVWRWTRAPISSAATAGPIELTATEFNLLRFFLLNPGQVLSKAQILDHVWHYDFGGEANVVETYVSYLRKKLEAHGPPLIHTIRLVGYVLRAPEPGRG